MQRKKLSSFLALACGLLAGTFREELLAAGRIRERVLTRADLARATAVHLINSVRRWIQVQRVGPGW